MSKWAMAEAETESQKAGGSGAAATKRGTNWESSTLIPDAMPMPPRVSSLGGEHPTAEAYDYRETLRCTPGAPIQRTRATAEPWPLNPLTRVRIRHGANTGIAWARSEEALGEYRSGLNVHPLDAEASGGGEEDSRQINPMIKGETLGGR